MTIPVTDSRDERLADYFALTDVALRRRLDTERGLYLAESDKVIRRALGAGHRPRSYLMAQRWVRELADLVDFLRRELHLPYGAVLSTGTCLVPDLPFTLTEGDEVRISVAPIGELVNPVARASAIQPKEPR